MDNGGIVGDLSQPGRLSAMEARLAVVETQVRARDSHDDRLRALELRVEGLASRLYLVGATLAVVIPLAVRLLL